MGRHAGKYLDYGIAYFTMVALDCNGRPMTVPPLKLETEEAKQAFEAGRKRHEMYHERKKKYKD